MNVAGLELYYGSDLHSFGYTVDGAEFIGEMFFIEAEDATGNRWRLNQRFPGVKVEQGEEGPYYTDIREQTRVKCDHVIEQIRERGWLNLERWSAARPAYGSEAYVAHGQADDLLWESQQ